jgi:hypothetical protein
MGKFPREAVDEKVIKAFREETEGFKKKFLHLEKKLRDSKRNFCENDDRD